MVFLIHKSMVLFFIIKNMWSFLEELFWNNQPTEGEVLRGTREKPKTRWQNREIALAKENYEAQKWEIHLRTRQQIRAFQRANWLNADGIIGIDTVRKMRELQWQGRSHQATAQQEQDTIGNFFSRLFSSPPEWLIRDSNRTQYERTTERWTNSQEKSKQFIAEYVPYNWRNIAIQSLRHLKNGEVYSPENPLLLFDTRTSQWILLYSGRSTEFPISISQYGTLQREYSNWWDHKTPTDWFQHFTDVYIAPTPEADASRSRKWANRGVTSARIESREADKIWQRWVHWMQLWSSTQPVTIGCIAIDNHTIRPIAHTIQTALSHWNKAFWYTA